MRIPVLGAGSMGTMCARLLSESPNVEPVLWTRRPEHAEQILADGHNHRYLPVVLLPPRIQVTSDVAEAVRDAHMIVAAVPTVYLRETLAPFVGLISPDTPIVSVAKGIERETLLRPSEMLKELFGACSIAAMCGPSHAEEIAVGMPASVVVASDDMSLARRVQEFFTSSRLRLYTNDDLVGVELAAALKNVIAIAAGACEGLQLGDNAKSALITRALVELIRYGEALGGRRETFYGLAGIGDLVTTCYSPFGRNRAVGIKLANGQRLQEILAGTNFVAEGVWTAKAVYETSQQRGIEMPICTEVYRVLYEDKRPGDALRDLMERSPKSELFKVE